MKYRPEGRCEILGFAQCEIFVYDECDRLLSTFGLIAHIEYSVIAVEV